MKSSHIIYLIVMIGLLSVKGDKAMKKIIGILQPFDAIQKVFVYDQGHQINSKGCSLE